MLSLRVLVGVWPRCWLVLVLVVLVVVLVVVVVRSGRDPPGWVAPERPTHRIQDLASRRAATPIAAASGARRVGTEGGSRWPPPPY